MNRHSRAAALACLLAGGCAIASAPILVRLSATGPVASAFWRAALAAPVLWAWATLSGGWRPGRARGAIVATGLFFAADLGVWHWSIAYTSVANATLLANLAPIFVTLLGWLVYGRTVSRLFLCGMATAIVGMFVLVGPSFSLGGNRLLGDALGGVTALFYAGYMLAVKVARDARTSTVTLMAWSSSITALALWPVAWWSPQTFWPADTRGWLVLVGLALLSQVVGQGLIAYAFAHLPASLSSVSLLIQPAMAAVFAWVVLGEPIGPSVFVGGGIVLVGIWLAQRGSSATVSGERRDGTPKARGARGAGAPSSKTR